MFQGFSVSSSLFTGLTGISMIFFDLSINYNKSVSFEVCVYRSDHLEYFVNFFSVTIAMCLIRFYIFSGVKYSRSNGRIVSSVCEVLTTTGCGEYLSVCQEFVQVCSLGRQILLSLSGSGPPVNRSLCFNQLLYLWLLSIGGISDVFSHFVGGRRFPVDVFDTDWCVACHFLLCLRYDPFWHLRRRSRFYNCGLRSSFRASPVVRPSEVLRDSFVSLK